MHARELAELAAQLATQGGALIQTSGDFDQQAIEQYWVASRCRLDRWSKGLSRYSARVQQAENAEKQKLQALLWPTLEEILVSELLTRVWTVVVIGHDKLRGTAELEPVARSIMVGHLEARHRTLQLMVYGKGFAVEEAVMLNRLRRKCERWNDLMLSALRNETDVAEFAFDATRVRDAALDLRDNSHQRITRPAWQILLASLRVSFQCGVRGIAANAELNEQIATAIISGFPAEAFDSLGIFRSSWLVRMHSLTSDTQGVLDDVLTSENSHLQPDTSLRRLEDQLRRF